MVEVIPTILVKTYEEFESLVRKVEPFVERVSLDISDGTIVPTLTIKGYTEIQQINTPLKFDIHLMVENPEVYIHEWLKTKVERIFFHSEARCDFFRIIDEIRASGKKIGIAVNPETDMSTVIEYIDQIDYVQFMAVHPGYYGGTFLEDVIGKISGFHQEFPEVPIVVDGGVTPEIARRLIPVGATILNVGSYIFNSENIEEAIKQLKNI